MRQGWLHAAHNAGHRWLWIASDPVRGRSFDSVIAAVKLASNESWRAVEVDQTERSAEEVRAVGDKGERH